MATAADIIKKLNLQPHPEGGWYAETWRADAKNSERPSGTSIYYLLEAGQYSHWHRIDATEIWHFYAGAPLRLSVYEEGSNPRAITLHNDFGVNAAPQMIIPPGVWQAAESLGTWTLVGCTVSPAFEFRNFELAPPDWAPPRTT